MHDLPSDANATFLQCSATRTIPPKLAGLLAMTTPRDRRRLLLASNRRDPRALRSLLETPLFDAWEVREADSVERARYVLQMEHCDVLALESALFRASEPEAVARLAARFPVLLLCEPESSVVVSALRHGVRHWLPRDLALDQPAILEATLRQAAQAAENQRKARVTGEALRDCRRQVERLVSLLWDAVPGDGRQSWFPQRHMLERLDEEIARSRRYGGPLSVAIGEAVAAEGVALSTRTPTELAAWTVARVTNAKRRSDIAGQYGHAGFIVLLPNTAGDGAVRCCRRIRVRLETPPPRALPPLRAAFGVVSLSAEAATVKGLLGRAEERLERAKRDRRQSAGV
jgi:GGDEF domain-containing protein